MKIAGKPVIDAKRPARIRINTRDVKRGAVKDPGSCAAALACMREFHCTDARVHLGRTYVKMGDHWRRYQTPQSLRAEIVAFDRGGKFAPGEYTLAKPSKKTSGRRQGSDKDTRKGKYKWRAPYHVTIGVRQHGANR